MERAEWEKSQKSKYPTQIGPWKIDPERGAIEKVEGVWYEIDLERCTCSAEVLDWIMQVEAKTWATDRDVACLVMALYFAIDPQASLCSLGKDSKLKNPMELAKKRMTEGV